MMISRIICKNRKQNALLFILFQETESGSYINQYHSGFQIDLRIRPFKLYLILVKILIIYLECRQRIEYGHMHRMCVCVRYCVVWIISMYVFVKICWVWKCKKMCRARIGVSEVVILQFECKINNQHRTINMPMWFPALIAVTQIWKPQFGILPKHNSCFYRKPLSKPYNSYTKLLYYLPRYEIAASWWTWFHQSL